MTRELFYNTHPHVDEERLVSQWLAWQPRAVLVMNNAPFAMRLQALRPGALVIARITDPFGTKKGDDAVVNLAKPADWLARMCELVPDARVVLYAGNECHGSEGAPGWTLEAMKLATAAGRRLCILNTGTGGPEDEEWWAEMPPTRPPDDPLPPERIGALAPVVRAWATSDHLLGIHEYATMLDWRAARGWQVGRYERHLDTFQKMGITVPRDELRRRIVITEATFDSIPHSEHKGARWLPAEDAARQMIEMARQVYWEMPVLMYCIGHNSDEQWRMFRLDYAGDETVGLDEWGRTFQAAIGAYMTAQEGSTVDLEKRERVSVTQKAGNSYANIRDEANGADIGDLVGVHLATRTVDADFVNGLYWRHYRFEDDTPDGWLADSAVEAVAAPLPPAPEPEPEPEPTPDPMTPERWLIVLQAQDDCMAAIERAVVELRGTLQETMDAIAATVDEA